jgi:vitamin B12 transporter
MLSRLTLAVSLALPSLALAQSASGTRDPATDLDEVVATGTRTAVTVDDSLAAVEVIDAAQIERSQARSLQELLRGRAGITVVGAGGLGKQTSLFLRGTESDHVLFLVDGVRVASATSGLPALQDLPLALVERVEIVRGPRSSLYGSDAVGGVIQIFTRRARGAGTQVHGHVGAGSHDLREASAGVRVGGERAWLGLDGAWQRTDGFQSCTGATTPVFAGCFVDAPDPDADGYRNRSLSLRAGVAPVEGLTLEGHALRAEAHNAFDADPAWGLPDNSDTVQQVVGAKLRFDARERLVLQLSAGRNTDASDQFLGAAFVDRFETRRDSASLQGDLTLAAGQLLTLGVDWQHDEGGVEGGFSAFDARRGNRAGFAQYQGRFGAHDLQASLRRDDNDQFGGQTTGSAAWGVDAGSLRATASYGTAFKAPTFNELYFPFFGNPLLRPEESASWEAGLAQRLGHWRWQLSAFHTTVDDLITYDSTIFAANNVDRARIRGAELTVSGSVAGWELSAQASRVDPRSRSGAYDGNLLPRRARAGGRFDADRAFGAWRVGASVIAEGTRFDDFANALRLGGYAVVDLRVEYALHPDWTLQARVANAADRDYATAAYFDQPGREYGLALRWRPAE